MPAFDPDQSQDRQAAMRAAMQKRQEQAAKVQTDALAVLTPAQSATWADLCGKKFTFPAQQFGRRGGGQPQPQ